MYTFRFNITTEDINAHVRSSLTEEQREKFKNVKFVPYKVECKEDMDIEVTIVAALDDNENENEE